jgi:AcrR family transcriptional regulator
MADAIQTSPASSRLGRSQAVRRARVLEAVLELANEGGYDAVQVRPLSDRTGVGSDTIYRYFGSRDRLMSEAVALWIEREFVLPSPGWIVGDTAAERLLSLSRRVWDLWERHPNMLGTMVHTSMLDDDPGGGPTARSVEVGMQVLADALAGIDDDYRRDVMLIMENTTRGVMAAVVRGHLRVEDVYPLIERVIRRLAQHPAMDGHRPPEWDYRPPHGPA